MKKIFVILGILFVGVMYSQAQTAAPDARLDAVYSEEYLQDLSANNPEKLEYMNWYLDNSYSIVDAGLEKCQQMEYLKHFDPINKIVGDNVEDIDEVSFNIYKFHFERQYDKKSYYRIGNSGKALVLDSYKSLAKKFNIYADEN